MRAETPAEQLFFTTVYLAGKDAADGTWTGTGFIVNYATDEEKLVPILVTNKHVLAGAVELSVRLVRSGPDGNPVLGATETVVGGFNPEAWLGHPDPSVDVAVLPLGPIVYQMEKEGRPAFYRAFSTEQMLTEAQALELDAIEQVTFVGYPNGLFDTESFLPIARRGQTATPLQNNYRGAPAFLIDASVFGGSSGSPVFIFDRGVFSDRRGNTTVGSRFHLLGVLAAVHIRQASGSVHDLPAKQIAVFDEPIDLGIVFKSSAIHLCVEELFKQLGLTMASKPKAPIE